MKTQPEIKTKLTVKITEKSLPPVGAQGRMAMVVTVEVDPHPALSSEALLGFAPKLRLPLLLL